MPCARPWFGPEMLRRLGKLDYWSYRNLLKHALLPLHVLGVKRVLEYCGKACNVCKTYILLALTGSWAGDELAAS